MSTAAEAKLLANHRMSQPVRTVFISDCHLGQKFARGDELLAFLHSIAPERLYLVGDFIDAWCIRWSGYWPPVYTQIINRIFELRDQGTAICYAPGNHDAFLRGPIPKLSGIEIANEFEHEMADGSRFLVLHGDLLDSIERQWKWLSRIGSFGFNRIIDVNLAINFCLRKLGLPPVFFSFSIKRFSKWLLGAFGRFRQKLLYTATSRGMDGIICGHVHFPQIVGGDGPVYINTGDWLEHASALMEHFDGTLELRNHGQVIGLRPAAQPSRASVPAASSSETT